MKPASVVKGEEPFDVWNLVVSLQKNPAFVRAVRDFIRRTTS
ncbi:MAG TPA: hypothetical protein VI934_00650 [Candidatus Nanoarchaeia archaeon]|nr:hypothetical protein [Candidatus Nanoarchaeia archaeon]